MKRVARNFIKLFLLLSLTLSLNNCQPLDQPNTSSHDVSPAQNNQPSKIFGGVEAYLPVDCLLPGQIRRLGGMTYVTARRPIRTTASRCEIRGGEYVAYDRANYQTALPVWLEKAKEGEPKAQFYVGEIYEKGMGRAPDYKEAVTWYTRAVEQGYGPAKVNLGQLYAQGLGVAKNVDEAKKLYLSASGLEKLGANFGLSEELENLKTQMASLQKQISRRESDLKKAIQALKEDQERFAKEKETFEADQRTLELERQGLKDQKELFQRDLGQILQKEKEIETRSQRFQVEKQELNKQIQEAKMEGTQLSKQKEAFDARVREFKKEQSELISHKEKIQRDLAQLRQKESAVAKQKMNDQTSNREHEAQIQKIEREKNDLEADKKMLQEERKILAAKLEEYKRQLPQPSSDQIFKEMKIDFGNYYALIVGIGDYDHLRDLPTADDDANDIAALLSKKYGYQVDLLTNKDAKQNEILATLGTYQEELTPKDNLLIYFAGHGRWVGKEGEAVVKTGYWLVADAQERIGQGWFGNQQLTDMVGQIKAKHILIVSDSCYAGGLTRNGPIPETPPGLSASDRIKWLEIMAWKSARLALTSGEEQPVPDSLGGKHSIFAQALLDVLKKNNRVISGSRLTLEVDSIITRKMKGIEGKQNPTFQSLRHTGHSAGQFFFVPAV